MLVTLTDWRRLLILDETRAPNQKGKRQKTTSPEYDSVKQRVNLCADYPSVHLPSHLRSFTHITPTSLRDDVILVSETDAGRTPEASWPCLNPFLPKSATQFKLVICFIFWHLMLGSTRRFSIPAAHTETSNAEKISGCSTSPCVSLTVNARASLTKRKSSLLR